MKCYRRCTAWSAALIALSCSPSLSASPETSEAVWTISPAITSNYVFRGVELAKTCFQPWVDYTSGSLSLGLWTSFALEDRVSGDTDPEIDLYGSYTYTVGGGSIDLVPGFYLYTYPDAETGNGNYSVTFEPSLAAVFTAGGIQFTPKVYYDFMLRGATFEISAAIAIPLESLGTELDFSVSAGTFKWTDVSNDTSPSVKNWGDYWTAGVAIPIQVTSRSKVTLAGLYSEGRNNFYKQGELPKVANDAAHGVTSVTLSYAISL